MPPKGWLRIAGYWSIRPRCQGHSNTEKGGIRRFLAGPLFLGHYFSISRAMRPKDFRKDRRPQPGRKPVSAPSGRGNRGPEKAENWVYGLHAVQAALANPRRRVHR